MTSGEMEAEIVRLRDTVLMLRRQDDERRSRWRWLWIGATFCAVLFALAGAIFSILSLIVQSEHAFSQQAGLSLILLSVPCGLLSGALREPAGR